MKRPLGALIALLLLMQTAWSDFVMVVPQRPGGGTSVWAAIVAREMEKFLGERISIRHLPGARDIPGFNIWHNELRHDPRSIMVSHGGNGVSFLQEAVDYDYSEYDSVGLMNLNIIAAKRTGLDPARPLRFASEPGTEPEAYAMAMLLCGPMKSTAEYTDCFKRKVVWVKAMSTAERQLAFKRGELTATRDNPAAFRKHVDPMIASGDAELWFHHGLFNVESGSHEDDPNYPGRQFEILYRQAWGVAPAGEFYDGYRLIKSFRDVLQKALWVNRGNPNLLRLREALRQLAASKESMAVIHEKVGAYDWAIGEHGDAFRERLMSLVTEPALRTLVSFNSNALGLAATYKPNLLK
jgi:hypothetical protein